MLQGSIDECVFVCGGGFFGESFECEGEGGLLCVFLESLVYKVCTNPGLGFGVIEVYQSYQLEKR